jgi:hypothetical protein
MTPTRAAFLLACTLTPSLGLQSATAAGTYECLEYGRVNLTGILVRQTYPGPPDYESLTKGDEPRIILILQLDSPVCVSEAGSGYPAEYNEREIQLEFGRDAYAQHRSLLGKRVVVDGELIRGGARHEKRLVLAASEIRRVQSRP